MPIDREATLKQAEKLLRQGRLDGAIAEYVRLVQDYPKDWNSVNALGDLYVRAGQTDKAVAQFTQVADFLAGEGFLPRAAALYKKIVKIKSDEEHALLQLADIATRQDLLVDAKMYLRQAMELRRARSDRRGVAELIVRLGSLEPDDPDAKLAAARAAMQLEDPATASAMLQDAVDAYEKQDRPTEALAALAEAARLDPQNHALRARLARQAVQAGNLDEAAQYLNADSAGDDPDLLLPLARMEFLAGREEEGRGALTRMLSVAPARRADAVAVGCGLIEQGRVDAAFTCLDLVADFALLEADWAGAADALHAFVERVPNHITALMKLVEICVDGGLEDVMLLTQARLTDAYLEAGRGAEARVIAEDLLARDPASEAHVERLRRALALLGVTDAEAAIAERLEDDEPFSLPETAFDALGSQPLPESLPGLEETEPEASPQPPLAASVELPLAPLEDIVESHEAISSDAGEIDLSGALAGLAGASAVPEPAAPPADAPSRDEPAPSLEKVFDDLRAKASAEGTAQRHYDTAIELLERDRVPEAMKAFEMAARVPVMRFQAAATLGRLHLSRGELAPGVEWLERAAEAPAPTEDDGHGLLYDLADALEQMGEGARALAILLELATDAGGFRDVATRIERLSRVQTES